MRAGAKGKSRRAICVLVLGSLGQAHVVTLECMDLNTQPCGSQSDSDWTEGALLENEHQCGVRETAPKAQEKAALVPGLETPDLGQSCVRQRIRVEVLK